MTTPAISCRQISRSFAGQRVLHDVDLTCQPGRVHALLGRNGAGKSTTFNILLGLLQADSGSVEVLGESWSRSSLEHIGATVNGPALYGHLSARENLRVHAALTGCSRNRIDEVLALVGLADTGRKRSRQFSTGMKARLALAIALLTDPEILILDEPQNGLDPEGIIELRQLIRSFAASGRTVLISSHQLGEVTHLADDISILSNGRVVWTGPLEEFSDGDLEQAYLRATQPFATATSQSTDEVTR